jgi:hypothetical protein
MDPLRRLSKQDAAGGAVSEIQITRGDNGMANDRTMQAQNYLQDYRVLVLRREALLEEKKSLHASTVRVGPDGNPDIKVPGEDALQQTIDHIGEALAVRLVLIELLTDEQQKLLLTYRYINGWSWEEIRRRMNYCNTQAFRIHRFALANLEALIHATP